MLALGLQAFPPGPGLTVFGTVRDTYGWAMSDDAMVVFRSGSTEIARTRIRPDANFTENYRVMLPVDTNRSGDPYKSSALNGLVLFTVEVQAAGATYYPLESLTGPVSGGQAGGSLRLDLSLGVDSDGDTLPDDWEYWQLQAAGYGTTHPDYNLGQLSAEGDFDGDGLSDYHEYLAGTFAFLSVDTLELEVVQVLPEGQAECEYLAVIGKSYRIESSIDMINWDPESVSLDAPYATRVSAWTSSQTTIQKVYLHEPSEALYYRLIVR
jgi:hypothetical protein